ncbi:MULTISPECIES: [Fe-Fe] hydrogenase large subunit C-terminal domain-containing protein [unclassified Thermoanaerobacterium]|uniref:[Fe-Fe] hydrogenase large subunit C-terminal domain-containing protein n=1 Tax=unclassified Thermoanaerobacterium TaxID=2622527 RepID=UPI000A160DCF|nr:MULTISPECIES: [Fe-Fe] hydrogenase large subunit C-terminal domain-containing protein [unclassified Thermoanaerobacterium]MDE4541512.1 4Fe-4S binding protein [Thermoanaerobacterium sp. R66]ORX23500.1 ferredoxin [Thermoanaerobacterium sp. PSU-2]
MYFHSVTLDRDRCKGCTNCIKRCPTEAIRVRDGKAKIIKEKCIDCGECVRVCPYHAKVVVTDDIGMMENYKYKIALPAPSLYGQFKDMTIGDILTSLQSCGFDEVFEVAYAADIVSYITRNIVKTKDYKRPIISSACPAIVRLIQQRFPSLMDNILDIMPPVEVAGKIARDEAKKKTGLKDEEIGVFFVSPCAAKVTSVKNPIGIEKSYINGVFSMRDVYSMILDKRKFVEKKIDHTSSMIGVGWANAGGESYGTSLENCLFVDGIQNVIGVLEDIELGKLDDIDFFEGLACVGGCVGGPLTVANNFVARNRIMKLKEKLNKDEATKKYIEVDFNEFMLNVKLKKSDVLNLDEDIDKAIDMMNSIDEIYKSLPGLDCGSCGSPGCRALAEDIVKGFASEYDCIFKLKDRIKILAEEINKLSIKIPPVIGSDKEVKP